MNYYCHDRFPEGSMESEAAWCGLSTHDERRCHECESRADGIEAYLELVAAAGVCPLCGTGTRDADKKLAIAVEALRKIAAFDSFVGDTVRIARETLEKMGVKV